MVMSAGYIPDRGDAVWITFDPQAGHEQAGRRPALVLSPAAYNGRVGLALMCPIQSSHKFGIKSNPSSRRLEATHLKLSRGSF